MASKNTKAAEKPLAEPAQTPVAEIQELHNRLGLGMKIIMALGAGLLFWEGSYQAGSVTLAILAITFVPLLMRSYLHVRIPVVFETMTVLFILLSLFLGEVQDFYTRFGWWDMVLHGGAGLLVGMTGFLLVYTLNEKGNVGLHLNPKFIAIFAFMFALGIGSIWEIFEFAMDSLFGSNMQKTGLVDTMWDIIVNCIGAFTVSLVGYYYLGRTDTDSFMVRLIDRFTASNPKIFRRRKKK